VAAGRLLRPGDAAVGEGIPLAAVIQSRYTHIRLLMQEWARAETKGETRPETRRAESVRTVRRRRSPPVDFEVAGDLGRGNGDNPISTIRSIRFVHVVPPGRGRGPDRRLDREEPFFEDDILVLVATWSSLAASMHQSTSSRGTLATGSSKKYSSVKSSAERAFRSSLASSGLGRGYK
jgi:hypothetical protein